MNTNTKVLAGPGGARGFYLNRMVSAAAAAVLTAAWLAAAQPASAERGRARLRPARSSQSRLAGVLQDRARRCSQQRRRARVVRRASRDQGCRSEQRLNVRARCRPGRRPRLISPCVAFAL